MIDETDLLTDRAGRRAYLGELGRLADELAVRPRLERVDGGRERDRAQEHEQVAERQVEDERVRHRAHRLVSAQDVDQAPNLNRNDTRFTKDS